MGKNLSMFCPYLPHRVLLWSLHQQVDTPICGITFLMYDCDICKVSFARLVVLSAAWLSWIFKDCCALGFGVWMSCMCFVICERKCLQIGFMGLDLESEPRPRNLVCSIYKALCDRTPVQNSNVYHVCKCMFQVSCLPFIWTSAVLWLLVRMAGSWLMVQYQRCARRMCTVRVKLGVQ